MVLLKLLLLQLRCTKPAQPLGEPLPSMLAPAAATAEQSTAPLSVLKPHTAPAAVVACLRLAACLSAPPPLLACSLRRLKLLLLFLALACVSWLSNTVVNTAAK
jgi:hypothetical protein